jgi:methylmalonyl-CoA mutase cobalamin-binding subunit
LRELGVAAVYTPKDFSLSSIMSDLLALVED